jgi:hypothetical protein
MHVVQDEQERAHLPSPFGEALDVCMADAVGSNPARRWLGADRDGGADIVPEPARVVVPLIDCQPGDSSSRNHAIDPLSHQGGLAGTRHARDDHQRRGAPRSELGDQSRSFDHPRRGDWRSDLGLDQDVSTHRYEPGRDPGAATGHLAIGRSPGALPRRASQLGGFSLSGSVSFDRADGDRLVRRLAAGWCRVLRRFGADSFAGSTRHLPCLLHGRQACPSVSCQVVRGWTTRSRTSPASCVPIPRAGRAIARHPDRVRLDGEGWSVDGCCPGVPACGITSDRVAPLEFYPVQGAVDSPPH